MSRTPKRDSVVSALLTIGIIYFSFMILDRALSLIYCFNFQPCPMCYSAIAWARIPALFFSASRFDASREGVGFQDEELHAELMKDYPERKIRVHQAPSSRALEAFELWKASSFTRY